MPYFTTPIMSSTPLLAMNPFAGLLNSIMMYIPLKREPNLPPALRGWLSEGYPKVSLDAAGLVALADLTTVARRTALAGTSFFLDALVVCPGLHKQQNAPELNGGEYPACAAMTTGYVFRVENPATVLYLQKVGRTGHLTTLSVTNTSERHAASWRHALGMICDLDGMTAFSTVTYAAAIALTMTVLLLMIVLRDWWAVVVVAVLILARLINVVIVRRRAALGWKGASEPGVYGDLLILLSQDRWVRMKGAVDDLKAITSGQWLREPSFLESSLVAFSTLLVYLDAALAGNAQQEGKVLLLILLFCSVGLLGVVNEYTKTLKMHDRLIVVEGSPTQYNRRLDLAQQLVKETGRDDWAVRLGMIVPKNDDDANAKNEGPITM